MKTIHTTTKPTHRLPVVNLSIDAITDDAGYAITANPTKHGLMREVAGGEQKAFRVDVYPPGTDELFPVAFVSMQYPRMTPAEARILATMLLTAADYAESLQAKHDRQA